MTKTMGYRGKGQAKLVWRKTAFYNEPLTEEELSYLSELAQIRNKMFDGRVRTPQKQEELEGRHFTVLDILTGFHSLDIRFPNVR